MKIRTGFVSNSSSSSFICDYYRDKAKYTVEETKEILQKILDFYNDIEEQNLSFEKVFEEPYIGSQKDVDGLDDFFGTEYPSYERANGRVIINSTEDNSVPHLIMGIIELKFNAEGFHLG